MLTKVHPPLHSWVKVGQHPSASVLGTTFISYLPNTNHRSCKHLARPHAEEVAPPLFVVVNGKRTRASVRAVDTPRTRTLTIDALVVFAANGERTRAVFASVNRQFHRLQALLLMDNAPPCVTFSTDTTDDRVVTANAVPSEVVLVGKFIDYQHSHSLIPPPWGEYVHRSMMTSCERHRNAVSITV